MKIKTKIYLLSLVFIVGTGGFLFLRFFPEIKVFIQNIRQVLAANYSFVQISWSGLDGGSYPNHTSYQTNWATYSSKDDGVTGGTTLTLTSTSSSWTQTSSSDFGTGTLSSTIISGNDLILSSTFNDPIWQRWGLPLTDLANLAPTFADLDNDGDKDLMVGTKSNGVLAYINNGSNAAPVWAAQASWNVSFGANTYVTPALADIDSDSDLDLMVGNVDGYVYAYKNTGSASSPTWTATTDWNGPDVGVYSIPTMADLDNDGDKDMIVGTDMGISFTFKNTCTSCTVNPIWQRWGLPRTDLDQLSPAFADMDNDGDKDMMLGRQSGGIIGYINVGSNTAPAWKEGFSNITTNWGANTYSRPTFGDIDGDGDFDLMIGHTGGTVYGYKNTGTVSNPSWSLTSAWNTEDVGDSAGPSLGDLDGDGDLDLLVGTDMGATFAYKNICTTCTNPTWQRWGLPRTDVANLAPTFADLDNDGDKDMLVGSQSNGVAGYENTGTNTQPVWNRKTAWDISFGANTYVKPTLVDLDADSDFDVMIGNADGKAYGYQNTGTVSSPTWSANAAWDSADVGSYAYPALADLDNDGDKDLLIGDTGGITYGYQNTGSASSPTWTASAGWNAADVGQNATPTLADIDGDSDFDLMIGSFGGIVYAHKNTGTVSSPTWTATASWDTEDFGANANPAFVNLDNDSDIDIMVGTGADIVYYRENTCTSCGNPTWSVKDSWDVGSLGQVSAPFLTDIDNDSDLDLMIGEYNSGKVLAYKNTGNTTSPTWTDTDAWDSEVFNGASKNIYPAFADFDNDGDKDMMAGFVNDLIYYRENTCTSCANPTWTVKDVDLPDIGQNTAPALADLDQDSDFDLMIGEYGGIVYGYKNTGTVSSATWSATATWDSEDFGSSSIPALADLDNDGDTDLVTGINPQIFYRKNSCTTCTNPTWAANDWDLPAIGSNSAPALADLDADNDLDAMVGDWGGIAYGYKNTGSASSPTWTATAGWNSGDVGSGAIPTVADLDNDGDKDMMMGESTGTVQGVQNTCTSCSNPTWSDQNGWDIADIADNTAPAFADLDNDGDKDMMIGTKSSGVLGYQNTGSVSSPTWSAQTGWNVSYGANTYSIPALGDIDGDGDFDLMVGHVDGNVYGYKNTGTASSPTWTATSTWNTQDVGAYTFPTLADLDGDGDTDLVVGTAYGVSFAYLNTTSRVYATPGTYTSPIYNTSASYSVFDAITWTDSGVQTVSMKVRTDTNVDMSTATAWGSCNAVTKNSDISSNNCVSDGEQYIQFQATLSTANTAQTPTLSDITVNFHTYPTTAQTLVSSAYNTESTTTRITSISWTETISGGANVLFQLRTAPNNSGVPGTWTSWLGPTGTGDYYTDPNGGETINTTHSSGGDDQWMQYKIFLSTTDGNVPIADNITIQYDVNTAPSAPTTLYSNTSTLGAQSGTENNPDLASLTPKFSAVHNDTDTGDVANAYQIQVGTDTDWGSAEMWDSGKLSISNLTTGNRGADSTYGGSALSWNTTYYWRIKFWDDEDAAGSWSATGSFTTSDVPSAPSVTSPSAGAVDVSRTPIFTTSSYSGDASHISTDWEIAVSNSFSASSLVAYKYSDSTNKTSITVNNTNLTFQNALAGKTELSAGTTYYVRARYTNVAGNSSYSSVVSFTAEGNATPNTPSVSDPADASTGKARNQVLTSSAFSDSDPDDSHLSSDWEISIDTSFSGSSFVAYKYDDTTNKTSIGINSTNFTFQNDLSGLVILKPANTYYVRVKHTDDSGQKSAWSSSISFTTGSNSAPNKPAITFPTAGGTSIGTNPTILSSSFSDSDDSQHIATSWEIYDNGELATEDLIFSSLADQSNLTNITVNNTNGIFGNSLSGRSKLLPSMTYFARILHTDPASANSEWSDTLSFSTIAAPATPSLSSASHPSETAFFADSTPDFTVSAGSPTPDHYHYMVNQTASPTKLAVEGGTEDEDGVFSISDGVISAVGTWYVHVIAHDASHNPSLNFDTFIIRYDSSAPTISDVTASNITGTSAVIAWNTLNASNSRVDYGTVSGSYTLSATDTNSVTSHSVPLSNLIAGTTYYFRVVSVDAYSQSAQSTEQSFTALPATTISSVQASSVSETGAVLTWTTNHPATSKANYGLSTEYGLDVQSSELTTSHSMTLTGLTPGETYYYEIISVGNSTATDAYHTFDTSGSTTPTTTSTTTGSTTAGGGGSSVGSSVRSSSESSTASGQSASEGQTIKASQKNTEQKLRPSHAATPKSSESSSKETPSTDAGILQKVKEVLKDIKEKNKELYTQKLQKETPPISESTKAEKTTSKDTPQNGTKLKKTVLEHIEADSDAKEKYKNIREKLTILTTERKEARITTTPVAEPSSESGATGSEESEQMVPISQEAPSATSPTTESSEIPTSTSEEVETSEESEVSIEPSPEISPEVIEVSTEKLPDENISTESEPLLGLFDLPSQSSTVEYTDGSSALSVEPQGISGHWAEDYVIFMADIGLIPESKISNIAPDLALTRCELSKTITEFFLISVPSSVTKKPFIDVAKDSACAPYVSVLQDIGIIHGYADGSFHPNQPVRRDEALKMILETGSYFFNFTDNVFTPQYFEHYKNRFADVRESDWYYYYLAFAVQGDIVIGYPDMTFRPSQEITRAEVTKILVHVLSFFEELTEGQETTTLESLKNILGGL